MSRVQAQSALLWAVLASLVAVSTASAEGTTKVCVEVTQRSWSPEAEEGDPSTDGSNTPAPEPSPLELDPAAENLPAGPSRDPMDIDPALYLRRMVEYEVTHEVGFEAVKGECGERITIELYPLRVGWTIFARYSGHNREEKVDRVRLDEFVALAQRLTWALLRDQPVSTTINRENVLRADSEGRLRTIDGKGHTTFALGGAVRVGELPTVGDNGQVTNEQRILTPLNIQLGYRGKYQAWALDTFIRGTLGTNEVAERNNEQGGHTDLLGSAAVGLHFLRYLDPQGMNSFYFGSGAAFELTAFDIIKAREERDTSDREMLFSGGLNLDLLIGYEFMRTNSVHFFVQGEIHLPLYMIDTENDAGAVETYLPGGLLQLGFIF
ncbi:MAG: hypothetical protein ACE366_05375 [Bradymonadia bacterium]